MPCPKSHFPVYAVTVASAPMASQESSFFGSMWEGCVSNCPCALSDPSVNAAVVKLTIRAPPLLRKSRRECMLPVRSGIFSDGTEHASVCETTAQDAAESNSNLFVRCVRLSIQDGLGREYHAAETE